MFHVVIPARFAASRLPGKPLLPIGDRPLIQWVWQCARASRTASVIVATDDVRIFESARRFGALDARPKKHRQEVVRAVPGDDAIGGNSVDLRRLAP